MTKNVMQTRKEQSMSAPTDNLVRVLVDTDAASLRAASDDGGDGRTLYGHFAVFNQWTEINSMWEGNFLERLAPGSFTRTMEERASQIKVLYDHGRDPQIGNKPLGPITDMREDETGAAYEVHLIDTPYNNEFIIPATRENLLGASFRFRVVTEEYKSNVRANKTNPKGLDERTITDVDLYEFGPVTFPAYADASAGVRSMTDEFMERLHDDPMFVARLTERLGLNTVTQMLNDQPLHPAVMDTTVVPPDLARYTIVQGDESVPELAAALDAVIDAAGDACDEGDMDTCSALVDACDVTADALMAALGLRDPDEMVGEPGSGAASMSLNSAEVAADGATSDPGPDDQSRSDDDTGTSADGQPDVDDTKPKSWNERKAFVRRIQLERVADA